MEMGKKRWIFPHPFSSLSHFIREGRREEEEEDEGDGVDGGGGGVLRRSFNKSIGEEGGRRVVVEGKEGAIEMINADDGIWLIVSNGR